MVSLRYVLCAAVVVAAALADPESSSAAPAGSTRARRLVLPRKPVLSPEKRQELRKVYEGEGTIEEKNKKVDEVAAAYSDEEKKVVETYKKFFAKRAAVYAKLSDPTKAIIDEIRALRKKEAEIRAKINTKEAAKPDLQLVVQVSPAVEEDKQQPEVEPEVTTTASA